MREAHDLLAGFDFVDPQRKIARDVYLRLRRLGNAPFVRFYEALFTTCPDVKVHFNRVSMDN